MDHVCTCTGACACGRPKPRPTNEQLAHHRARLTQLAAGQFEDGSPVPTEADIALVTSADPKDGRLSGALLTDWMNRGWLPGMAPQRTAPWRRRDGSPAGMRGVA